MRHASRPAQNVIGRVVGGLFAIALGLVAVFLFTAFAAVAAGLALIGLGRLWWLQRRGGGGDSRPDSIDAEYTVERDPAAAREPDAILPPRARDS